MKTSFHASATPRPTPAHPTCTPPLTPHIHISFTIHRTQTTNHPHIMPLHFPTSCGQFVAGLTFMKFPPDTTLLPPHTTSHPHTHPTSPPPALTHVADFEIRTPGEVWTTCHRYHHTHTPRAQTHQQTHRTPSLHPLSPLTHTARVLPAGRW